MKRIFLLLSLLLIISGFGLQVNAQVKQINSSEFKELVSAKNLKDWEFKGNKPVVVDFFATWCGPCKQVAPIFEEIASEYKDSVDFYKVDTDQNRDLIRIYGINSIPTFMFIPVKGEPIIKKGVLSKDQFKELIDNL